MKLLKHENIIIIYFFLLNVLFGFVHNYVVKHPRSCNLTKIFWCALIVSIVVFIISILILSSAKKNAFVWIAIVSLLFGGIGFYPKFIGHRFSLITLLGHCIVGFYLGQTLFVKIVFRDLNNALTDLPSNDEKYIDKVLSLKEDCLSVLKLITELFLALCVIMGVFATILFNELGILGNTYHIFHIGVVVVGCAISIYFFTLIPGYEFILKIRKKVRNY